MELFIVPEMTFKGYSRSSAMSPFVRSLDFLLETGELSYTYIQTKIVETTLNINQDLEQRHNSIGHTSLFISGLQ